MKSRLFLSLALFGQFLVSPATIRAQVYEKVFSFTEARAATLLTAPLQLVQNRSGNRLGIGGGGLSGYGTIFKVNADHTLSTLVEFTDNGATNRGATPISLVEGADGNFYGTTYFGGAFRNSSNFGYGTAFRVTPGGVLTTLAEFAQTGGNNRGSGPICLVQGLDGNLYGATAGGGANFSGTLFRLTPSGTLTTLIDFTFNGATNRGTLPNSLVQGSDGFFYGTTQVGGANDKGTLFRWMPGNAITTLYEFSGGDGEQPTAALVETADGEFYGTTSQGGANGFGTVFRLKTTPSVSFTTFVNFTGTQGGARGGQPSSPLVAGPDGALYGLTSSGGSFDHGTFFRITTAGTHTTLVDFTGVAGDKVGSGPRSLFQSSDGFFHGVTNAGGANGAGTIFQVNAQGVLSTEVELIGGNLYGRQPYGGLTQHADGNLYGTTRSGGNANRGTIFKMTPAGEVTTLAHFATSGNLIGRGPTSSMVYAPNGFLFGTTSGEGQAEATIFAVASNGNPTTIRENMAGANGLSLGASGLMYGTVTDRSGGFSIPPPTGRIFSLATSFSYADVVTFPGDGSNTGTIPLAGVTPDGSELWGTTSEGGTNSLGTVYSYTPGSMTTVANFTGITGVGLGSKPLTRLVKSGAQTFLGATSKGGTNNFGTIFRVQRGASGLTTMINFSGVGNVGSPQTFSNSSVVTLNDRALATPYPSTINVPAGIDAIGRVRVTLNGFEHTYPEDARFVLVSPTGQSCLLMAAAGGGSGVSGVALTFADNASATVPSPIASGSYRPTPNDFENTHITTDFMAFAQIPPFPPYGTEMSVFQGQAATGTWSLYAVDTASQDIGRLAGGWILEISPVVGGGTNVGSEPVGGLVQAQDGNFYGTTSKGGTNNLGTVFKLTPGGLLTTLHEFKSYDAKDAAPCGDLMIGADGNIYGTATGNNGGDGSIFRIVTQGAPGVAALPVADRGSRKALLRCSLNPRGAITSATLEYGLTSSASDGSISLAANQTGYSTRQFGTVLTGLEPNTTYYFRIRATNTFGTSTSAPVSQFTTLPEPLVTVLTPTGVGPNSATFRGTVNALGAETHVTFAWGTDGTSFPNTLNAEPETITGSTDVLATASVGGLVSGQTYYYRLVATNTAGTVASISQSFVTLTKPLVVSLAEAENVTIGGARLSGVVNARGTPSTASFVYGTDGSSFPNSIVVSPQAGGTADMTVSATLSNLSSGTTYFYRLTATNLAGDATPSAPKQFTTLALPVISGLGASDVGSSTATLNAMVDPKELPTVALFEYGPAADNLPFSVEASPSELNGSGAQSIMVNLTGLLPEQNYFFRVRAMSSAGELVSQAINFIMAPSAKAVTGGGTATLDSATFTGTANGFGQATVVAFDYGTNASTLDQTVAATPSIVSGFNDVPVSATVPGLNPNTTYYFRLKASNGGGTTFSQTTQSVTTGTNIAPLAQDDFFFYSGQVVMNPLENDSDANDLDVNGQPGNVRLAIQPTLLAALPPLQTTYLDKAKVVVPGLKLITYNAGDAQPEEEYFRYEVQDTQLASATARIHLIHFRTRAGLYTKSFAVRTAAASPEVERGDALSFQLSRTGSGTGRLFWEGARYPLSGDFNERGILLRTPDKDGDSTRQISIRMALPETVSKGKTVRARIEEIIKSTGEVILFAELDVPLDAVSSLRPGLLNGFLAPVVGAFDRPQGFLALNVRNTPTRRARLLGRLPDTRIFSAQLSVNRFSYELSVPIGKKGRDGVLKGTITILQNVDGAKPAAMAGTLTFIAANGSESVFTLDGAQWRVPLRGFPVPLSAISNATQYTITLRLGGGGLADSVDAEFVVTARGAQLNGVTPAVPGTAIPDKLKLTLNAKTGIFHGSFVAPSARAKTPFNGVLVPAFANEAGEGRGNFGSPLSAGSVFLSVP